MRNKMCPPLRKIEDRIFAYTPEHELLSRIKQQKNQEKRIRRLQVLPLVDAEWRKDKS